jgi:hypothetical protein
MFTKHTSESNNISQIRVITKLPNSEQSYKGKVKTHKYINRQKSINNIDRCYGIHLHD